MGNRSHRPQTVNLVGTSRLRARSPVRSMPARTPWRFCVDRPIGLSFGLTSICFFDYMSYCVSAVDRRPSRSGSYVIRSLRLPVGAPVLTGLGPCLRRRRTARCNHGWYYGGSTAYTARSGRERTRRFRSPSASAGSISAASGSERMARIAPAPRSDRAASANSRTERLPIADFQLPIVDCRLSNRG